jgi:hypothetical protein
MSTINSMKQTDQPKRSRWQMTNVLVVVLLLTVTGAAFFRQAPRANPVGAAQPAAIPPVPRPLFIYSGECGDLADVAWPLNELTSPDGTAAGSTDADRTEYSFTANVPLTIDALLAGAYAINVHESADKSDVTLACGNIGGVPDAVGTLVVGLRLMGELDVTGIAVLSPSPSDASRTLISVFITGSALGHETGTLNPESTATPVNTAAVQQDTPAPGQPTPIPVVPTDVIPPTEVEEQPTEVEREPTEVEEEPTEDDHGGHGGDDGGGDDNSGPGSGDDNSGSGG